MSGPNFPYTGLSSDQVIRQVYDETTDRLRVDSTATIVVPPGGLEVNITQVDDSIRIGDGTNLITATTSGLKVGLDVNLLNQLTDYATETTLSTLNGKIPMNLSVVSGRLLVDGSGVTQPVSAISLPLPTGAATEATLLSIDTKLNSPIAVSGTVTANLGTLNGAATEAKQDSQITELTAIKTAVQNIDAGIPTTLGQQTMANSMSMTLASDQTALSIAEPIMTEGSIDGTSGGTKYGFVYNLRQQVLAAHDRIAAYTYADFGTKDERVTQIDYTSSTFSGNTIRRIFNYTLSSGSYRMDSENWTVV